MDPGRVRHVLPAERLAAFEEAASTGQRARERVRDHFLSVRSLVDYFALVGKVVAVSAGAGPAPTRSPSQRWAGGTPVRVISQRD